MATDQPGDNKVKLETMIITMEPIPWNTRHEEFAVQVVVTAPSVLPVKRSEAAEGVASGVDLVAVLDTSAGMNEDGRLERMKEAMISVMGQLGPDDRLCILSFNDEVRPLTELCYMTDENWSNAAAKIHELTAPAGGGADVKAATDAAATVLAQRGEAEQSNRVGRVIFLSGGADEEDTGAEQNTADTSPEFSPDTASPSPEVAPPPGVFVLGGDDRLSALSFGASKASGAYTCVNDNVDKITASDLTSVPTTMGVQVDVHAQDGVAISSIESGSGGNRVRIGPNGPRSITIYIKDLHAGDQRSFIVYLKVPEAKEELLAVTGFYSDPETDKDVQLAVSEVFILRPKDLSEKAKMMAKMMEQKAIAWASDPFSWALPCIAFLHMAVKLMGAKAIAWARNPRSSWALPRVPFLQKVKTMGKKAIVWASNPCSWALPCIPFLRKVKAMGKKAMAWASNPYSWALPCIVFLLLGATVYNYNGARRDLEDGGKMEKTIMFRKLQNAGITSINRYIYQAFLRTVVPAQDVCSATGDHVCPLELTVQMLEAEKEQLRVKMETLGEEIEKAKTRMEELNQLLQIIH